MMSTQEMQSEFEAFCAMEGDLAIDRATVIRAFVWAWNRSRAAVVVELPSYRDAFNPYADDVCYNEDELKAAIEAAGLKVKP